MSGTRFTLEVQPRIPNQLKRLEELANDLLYSWDRQVRRLFSRLDQDSGVPAVTTPRCSCGGSPSNV